MRCPACACVPALCFHPWGVKRLPRPAPVLSSRFLPKGHPSTPLLTNGHHHPASDHGYPVRCVVPGTVGARNVKWLGKVLASAK